MLLDEIANYLASTGIGTVGVSIFKSMIPTEAPNQCVVISEYGGLPTTKVANYAVGSAPLEWPRFQVMVRSNPLTTTGYYSTARVLINSCYRALDGLATSLSSVRYVYVEALAPPFAIGLDDNERQMFVANFQAAKEITST